MKPEARTLQAIARLRSNQSHEWSVLTDWLTAWLAQADEGNRSRADVAMYRGQGEATTLAILLKHLT